MAIITYKPTSAGRRNASTNSRESLSTKKPEKNLVKGKSAISGRGATGRINVRFRGGAHKRKLRDVDFVRARDGLKAKVVAFEYDPNRSANLALIQYIDGVKSYILAADGLKIGEWISSGVGSEIKVGNHLPLKSIPLGLQIHNIELKAKKGGQLVRSAGASAQLIAKEGEYVTVRMPSGEVRMVNENCRATFGAVSNPERSLRVEGKAGRMRWKGVRPTVRGTAMNPVDHPHGGGEGKHKGNTPQTPWGLYTKGLITRSNKKSNKLIVKRRKKK